MSYIPQLGAVGVYALQAPFDTLLTPQVAYTCRSLRMLSDIAASGELVWERFYAPLNVSEQLYLLDLNANVCIVGLQAGTGEWIYVPSSFILKAPDVNGVLYSPVVLGVNLGPIKDSYQLDGLIGKLEGVVEAVIGIKPVIKGVLISQPAVVSYENSAKIEAARAKMVTDTQSDYSKVQSLTAELTAVRVKLKALEDYIKLHLP